MGKADSVSFTDKKRFNWKRFIIFSSVTVVISLALLIGGLAYIYSITPAGGGNPFIDSIRFIVKPGETAFKGNKTMNILCLGIDNNYTENGMAYTKGARSDTIFILSIDSQAQQVNMLSIPRDIWLNIPGYGYDKINSAYALGGINLAKKVVSSFLGITIDHFIIIRVKAAKEIVDTIGGLEIDVPKDMDYDDNWGNLHIHLKKGPQVLDGSQAVGFARFRHDEESDWGRMKRQQQVINAIIKEMKKPENFIRMDKIVNVVHKNIDTDLDMAEIIDICRLYKDFDRQNMLTGVVKGEDAFSNDGASIILPDENEKTKLVKRLLLRDGNNLIANRKISIFNGSQTEGLATELANYLESEGYDVVKIADADKYDYEDSIITDYTASKIGNVDLKKVMGYISLQTGKDAPYNEDYSIIIGNKWLEWRKSHPLPYIEPAKPYIRDYTGVRTTNDYETSGGGHYQEPRNTQTDSTEKPAAEDPETPQENSEHNTYTEPVTDPVPEQTEPTKRYVVPIPQTAPKEGPIPIEPVQPINTDQTEGEQATHLESEQENY